MKIHLPTSIEVEVSDKDLLTILKQKRIELLQGADYAEQEDGKESYWLWKDNSLNGVGKPSFEKMKSMTKLEYQLLESFTNSIYQLQQFLEEK